MTESIIYNLNDIQNIMKTGFSYILPPEIIKHIQKIKDNFPDYNLIGIINNNINEIYIYNQIERAIILSSIKLIDNVIMDYEYIQDNNLYIDLNNSIEFNKKEYIMNINFDKFKKKLKLIN
jgi:glycerol-3-phosphate cytidylyltransferase-like family protein